MKIVNKSPARDCTDYAAFDKPRPKLIASKPVLNGHLLLLHTAKYSCNRDLRYGRFQKATKMISTGQLGLLKSSLIPFLPISLFHLYPVL